MAIHWLVLVIALSCFIQHTHCQREDTANSNADSGIPNPTDSQGQQMTDIDTPSIPVHNDTSRDEEGIDHDSVPMKNGTGALEAECQNRAFEMNETHGHSVEIFQQMVLDQHNIYRRLQCANDLTLDDKLTDMANKIAHDIANNGLDSHQPSQDYGENIYHLESFDVCNLTGDIAVKHWYNESTQYNPDNVLAATGFSQVVWKESTKLGAGHAYNGHTLYIVAVYEPPGNIEGQFIANVGCGSDHQDQRYGSPSRADNVNRSPQVAK